VSTNSKHAPWLWFLSAFAFSLWTNARATHDESWRQVDIDTVTLIYPEGAVEPQLIEDLKKNIPKIISDLSSRFGASAKEHIVLMLDPRANSHNGWATVVPSKRVSIFVAPPYILDSIGEGRDWTYETVLHELTHISHLGMRRGWMKALYYTFGTIVAPNATFPMWLIEGLAVHYETKLSKSGRGRSSFLQMVVNEACRADVFGDPQFGSLDQLGSPGYPWPLGLRPYLIGADFLNFIEGKIGEVPFQKFHDKSAGWFPFFWLLFSENELGGKDWDQWWKEYVEWRRSTCQRGPSTSLHERTNLGFQAWSPLATPRGTFFFHTDPDEFAGIFQWKPGEPPKKIKSFKIDSVSDGRQLSLTTDGNELVYGMTITLPWSERHEGRVFAMNLESKKVRRLTGENSRDPDVHQKRLVYVHDNPKGGGLRIVDLQDKKPAAWACPAMHRTDFYQPRFDPSGKFVVVTAHPWGELHQLWRCDLETGRWARLASHREYGLHSANFLGEQLVTTTYHEGREPELWLVQPGQRRMCRVAELAAPARFQPHTDGRTLAYVVYTNNGFEIERKNAPPTLTTGSCEQLGDTQPIIASETPTVSTPVPSESYNPLPQLVPRFWVPLVYASSDFVSVGAATAQWDILMRHRYDIAAMYEFQPKYPSGYVDYVYRPWSWMSSTTAASLYNDRSYITGTATYQGTITASQNFSFPLEPDKNWSTSIGFVTQHRLDQGGQVPVRANALTGYVLWSDTDHRALAPTWYGASWRVGADTFRHNVGSQVDLIRVSQVFRWHLETPWSNHHILKAHVSSGWTHIFHDNDHSIPSGLYYFSAGGTYNFSEYFSPSTFFMRGYPVGTFQSGQLHVINAGYEFPLMKIYRGWNVYPIFFQSFTGEILSDWLTGRFNNFPLWKEWFGSIGGEIKLHSTIGYNIPVTWLAGVYYGFRGVAGGEFQWRLLMDIALF
jgi:hypothetical protein